MARFVKVVVLYVDGVREEYYGGIHLDNNVLQIWPQHGAAVSIPLVNIRKYETSD